MYRKGRAFEYKIRNLLLEKGFYVIRSAGSHTLFDLVAFGKDKILLIQCKANKLGLKAISKLFEEIERVFPFSNECILFVIAFKEKRRIKFALKHAKTNRIGVAKCLEKILSG